MSLQTPMTFIKTIGQNTFAKNLSVVIGGTALAQLITIACTPIIVRQYGTEALGLFGIFMALTGLLGTIVTGRYNLAIMLPKDNKDSALAVNLSLIVTLFIVLVLIVGVLLVGTPVVEMLNAPTLAEYIWLLPLVVLILGFKQSLEQWFSRHKNFATISMGLLIGSIIANLFKISLGFFSSLAEWLIIGSGLAFLTQLLVMLCQSNKVNYSLIISSIDIKKIKATAFEYSYLPAFRAPKDFLNSIAYNAPSLFLAAFFGASQVGLFTLAERMLRLPSQIIGDSVRKVLYQKIAESHNQEINIAKLLLKSSAIMAILSVIPFGLVIAFGPDLFGFVFGDEWQVAGEYGRWLAIAMFFNFVAIPSVVSIPVLRAEKTFFYYEIIYILSQLLALVYGGYVLNSVLHAIALYCITGALLKALLPIYICLLCNKQDRSRVLDV